MVNSPLAIHIHTRAALRGPHLRRGRKLCYLCKVLVGPGTPYLGAAITERPRRHVKRGCIASALRAQHH